VTGRTRVAAVAGEALVDLFVDAAGRVDARPGGGPFNVARAIARLGQPAAFLGRLSGDRFGQLLRTGLERDGVQVAIPAPAAAPTTLAVVDIGPAGVPRYQFYLSGTSGAALSAGQAKAALPASTIALHVGSLGLAMEPIAASLEELVAGLPASVIVMLDPNCRPGAITSRPAYLDRLNRILGRADVVKASTEDLAYLFPDSSAEEAASAMLGRGPASVVVTDGPHPARAFLASGEVQADVPPVDVVDTVGAGDSFGGAFLAWWVGNGLSRDELRQPETVRSALLAAVDAAVVTCTRAGAEPPWADDVAGHEGWAWLSA
jgi:fructokinase